MTKRFASLRNDNLRILAENETTSNDTWDTGRNNNDLIIGPTGSGKTRGYVKPNLLEASESLIITDTKGNLFDQMKDALEDAGYEIQLMDFTRPERSIGYNPFDFIGYDSETGEYDQKDIATMAKALYSEGKSRMTSDPYWDEAAEGLLRSMISCLLETTVEEDHSIEALGRLLEKVEAKDDCSGDDSQYARLMMKLRAKNPQSYAATQYFSVIEERAQKTVSCVKMILGAQLTQLTNKELTRILSRTEKVNLRRLANRKTALFLVISDMDRSQDKLANLFYCQALQDLCRYADRECTDNCLPVPVRFILDDFATNACIPNFDKQISVIRSRGISVSIILQSMTQLENMYGDKAAYTIINGCDTMLYMGGQDLSTAHYIGTRTDQSDYNILSLPLDKSWLIIRGQEPRLVSNYKLEDHPRYMKLPEAVEAVTKATGPESDTDEIER